MVRNDEKRHIHHKMKTFITLFIIQLMTVLIMDHLIDRFIILVSIEKTYTELINIRRGMNIIKFIPCMSQLTVILLLFVLSINTNN